MQLPASIVKINEVTFFFMFVLQQMAHSSTPITVRGDGIQVCLPLPKRWKSVTCEYDSTAQFMPHLCLK